MKTVEGSLTMLGNAVIGKGVTTYSIIEIGDVTLQKIKIPTSLDNYLSRALNETGNIRLFLNNSILIGIEMQDGKLYCYDAKPIAAVVLIILGIATLPIFGLGLIFIIQGFAELKNSSASAELKNRGATAISI